MTERAAYWSAHLAAIEREGITTVAYAAREGLSVGALYQWRRELKARAASPSTPSAGFVAVTVPTVTGVTQEAVACRLRLSAAVTLELGSLPNARWLAGLVEAMGCMCSLTGGATS